MRSLAVRVTLLAVFIAATCASAYLFWSGESAAQAETSAARAFNDRALGAAREVLELRAAQQAYVAAGQGEEFWISKVATTLVSLQESLPGLRGIAMSLHAQSAVDNATSSMQDLEQMDRRAREFARGGQRLLASDLIFADGLSMTGAAVASLDQARTAEFDARLGVVGNIRQRQIFAVGAAAAAALLAIVLLVPLGRHSEPTLDHVEDLRSPDRSPATEVPPHTVPRPMVPDDGPTLKIRDVGVDDAWAPARVARPTESSLPAAVALPLDLAAVAALCTDLARVVDTRSLPAILERAASVLDAPGIVIWIADPDGRELSPIVTHGYSPQVVVRLGTIQRDSENVTAAAFRTSLLQIVKADATSNGAIAAPLVTPSGTVGVMAAEVRQRGESDPAKLAAAQIVAAQLATLVGPPSSRAHANVEATGG